MDALGPIALLLVIYSLGFLTGCSAMRDWRESLPPEIPDHVQLQQRLQQGKKDKYFGK